MADTAATRKQAKNPVDTEEQLWQDLGGRTGFEARMAYIQGRRKNMAACIAIARGHDSSRVKETHRLGSKCAEVEASTWRTFVYATTWADGRVEITVKRGSETVHTYTLGPEVE